MKDKAIELDRGTTVSPGMLESQDLVTTSKVSNSGHGKRTMVKRVATRTLRYNTDSLAAAQQRKIWRIPRLHF